MDGQKLSTGPRRSSGERAQLAAGVLAGEDSEELEDAEPESEVELVESFDEEPEFDELIVFALDERESVAKKPEPLKLLPTVPKTFFRRPWHSGQMVSESSLKS